MTHDYNGTWNNFTGHNAPLYRSATTRDPAGLDVDSTVTNYLARGAPAAKLVLGVPFYGRSWAGVGATNNGLAQSATRAGPGTWEAGSVDYSDIVRNYLPTFTGFRDPASKVPYLYNPASKVFVPTTIRRRCRRRPRTQSRRGSAAP